ncbi:MULTISPECIES: CDP-alcohol phosphatidyltransferase family protein [unclassified Streptomyces]|uniref:CDP-alcohol phosphatidyltransferase family protein n=1 Tax=unclassified Streptomyces TaxID=2593676 RepID=UPI003789D146
MGSTGTVLRELRGAQKSAKGVSLYSRYVNRPAGRLLAAGAFRAGMTPNQVTLTSALFTYGALASVALVEPSWTLAVVVYAALAVGFAFDSADGQLARLTGRGGPDGEWLDHVVDCGKLLLVHAAVLISFYRFGELPSDGWLLLPLGFQLAAVLTFCAGLLREQLGKAAASARGPSWAAPAAPVSRVRAVALLPADYGVFCLVFLLLGAPGAFRTGYAVLAVVHTLFLAAFLAKWFRELKALRAG